MSSITRWVLAHKRTVILFWLVLTVVGIASADSATKAMDQKFSVPGKEGWETNVAIAEHFGGTGGDTRADRPGGHAAAGQDRQLARSARAAGAGRPAASSRRCPGRGSPPTLRPGDRSFVSTDGRTTFAIVYPKPDPNASFGENPDAAKTARAGRSRTPGRGRAGPRERLRRAPERQSGSDSGTGVLLESVLGGVGALIVLAFVFASFLALVPIAMAIVSIMTTFLLVWGLTTFTDISPVVQFLIALVGLGVAIDYSLLVVSRWREERAHGRSGDEAVQRAMETAGRAVVFSGTTVAIGLLAMVALPVPFLRSMGYGGHADPAGQHAGRDHAAARWCCRRSGSGSTGRTGAPMIAPAALGRAGPRRVVRHRWVAAGQRGRRPRAF